MMLPCAALLLLALPALPQAVTTAQYDNARTGANLHETILTPRNIAAGRFGKLFSYAVDGDVYAQPLYMPRLEIPGKGVHNVVLIATERDSVYAFDAAGQPADPLWRVSFLNERAGVRPSSWSEVHCSFIGPDIGITPTPVIDVASRTIYVIARTTERQPDGRDLFYQRLHALDLATGAERPGSPALIRASVAGSTFFGLFSKEVRFNAALENPRAAMLFANGTVYIAWGSSCDVGPYYGWVLAYDSNTLKQTGVFNTAPDATESGIWQSDTGIAADPEGNVYAVTGNGKFTAASGGRDYGDTVLKLGFQNGALAVRDYFTPHDESHLNRTDEDLGACGPLLLPDRPGAHPHLMVATGKTGVVYLIDRDRMGKFHAGSDSHAVQTVKAPGSGVYGVPAYWNGRLYFFGADDALAEFAFAGGMLAPAPAHRGAFRFGNPGAIPSVSANGSKDGVVWVVLTKGFRDRHRVTYATLQAYDAEDVSRLLFSTSEDARQTPGEAVRYTMPTVADGRVYVGSRGMVYVFGLLAGPGKHR